MILLVSVTDKPMAIKIRTHMDWFSEYIFLNIGEYYDLFATKSADCPRNKMELFNMNVENTRAEHALGELSYWVIIQREIINCVNCTKTTFLCSD